MRDSDYWKNRFRSALPPEQGRSTRPYRGWLRLAALLILALGVPLLSGCGDSSPAPEVTALSAAATKVPASPTPLLSPTPTVTRSPRAVTVKPVSTADASVTSTIAAVPSPTRTPTPVASGLVLTGTLTPTVTPSLTPTPQFSPTPLPLAAGSEGWTNLLLLGLDSTANLTTQNTDVIIVLSINPETRQISLLSIPRDLWVYIPTYGWSRINTAHKRGYSGKYPGEGPALMAKTIEMNLGIPIDHWARIGYEGFVRAVDAMGGVDITVACPVNLQYLPSNTSPEGQILQPGVYHMDGNTALRYVRTRRGGSDFDRARRQQQFLRALWQQTKELDLGSVVDLFASLQGSITTDLTVGDVLSLAPVAKELQPQRIRSRYIGANQTTGWINSQGWRVLLPRYDKIQQVVASLYAPPSAGEDQTTAEGARIQIRNGTTRPELVQILVDDLRWHGLNAVDAGPADRSDYVRTQILMFSDKPKTAELLVQVLGKSADVIQQPDPSQPVDIQVILGSDYDPCQ